MTGASKRFAVLLIAAIYIIAFITVYLIFPLLPFSSLLINLFIADVIATLVIYIFSMIFNNSSIYDPYWSLAPPVIAVYFVSLFPDGNRVRQLVITALVLFWGVRLTLNWLRGWQGLRHQDWRYTSIAEKTGKMYWIVSFLGIHFMPTAFVFLGCLPLWYSMSAPANFNVFDLLAGIFTFSAILTEWIADEQLHRFRISDKRNRFIGTGLWQYSRHPNYLGEISFWGGMFLFVPAAYRFGNSGGYWTIIGLVLMILLFTLVSIPLMEKRNRERKPGYPGYVKEVPPLLPRIFHKRN